MNVIDNFLNEQDAKFISETMFSEQFPWNYINGVSDKKFLDKDYYFIHPFYDTYQIISNYFKLITPILKIINPKAIIRCKGNLFPNSEKLIEYGMHSDFSYNHKGLVYYVNTNNGYTGFGDGTKVQSIANRAVIFDSSVPHYSTNCTDDQVRINININYF